MFDPNSKALIPYVPPQNPIPEEPTVEEIADRFVRSKKEDWISTREWLAASPSFRNSTVFDKEFDEDGKRKEFMKLETNFRKVRPFPKEIDSYGPAGGLQWSMTAEQIHSHVQEKFVSLKKSGILLRRSEFVSQEDPTKFRKPGRSGLKCGTLDRLWGGEYLRENLAKDGQYRVPRFILVVEDDIETLPVKVWQGNKSLFISSIDTDHGELLVEKINDATPDSVRHQGLRIIGYVDYSDPGNILRGADGKYYIVDTEWSALEGVVEGQKFSRLRNYAIERFSLLNPWLSKIINIKL